MLNNFMTRTLGAFAGTFTTVHHSNPFNEENGILQPDLSLIDNGHTGDVCGRVHPDHVQYFRYNAAYDMLDVYYTEDPLYKAV